MPQHIAKTVKGPIEYRLEGNGPTIVVLNGGHCSRETRLSHERLIKYGFSVLTPSRPGYDSTPAEVGTTAQTAADAIALLLDTLQISMMQLCLPRMPGVLRTKLPLVNSTKYPPTHI